MVCKSEHSDNQLVSKSEIAPVKGGNEGGWWSYVSLGIGYVAIGLSVMGDFVGAHEMAVAIMDMADKLDGRGGEGDEGSEEQISTEEEEEVDQSQEG